jgi:hypothetical protein
MYCRRDRLHIRGCGRGLFNDPHFLFCSLTTRRAGTFCRFPPLSLVHSATKFQFERAVREFSQARAAPEDERSPAPPSWWQPAFAVATHQEHTPRVGAVAWNFPSPRRRGRSVDGNARRSNGRTSFSAKSRRLTNPRCKSLIACVGAMKLDDAWGKPSLVRCVSAGEAKLGGG